MRLRNAEKVNVGSGYNKHESAVWCHGYLTAQNHMVADNSASTNTGMASAAQIAERMEKWADCNRNLISGFSYATVKRWVRQLRHS